MAHSGGLRRISIALAVIGMIISGYFTWIHITDSSVLCTGVGGCDAVRQSIYSEVTGIPVAMLGLIGFIAIIGCLLIEELQGSLSVLAPIFVLGLSRVGVLYSAYLS